MKNKGLDEIHASRIFNCDETNIQLIPKSEKILTEKGAPSAYKIVDGCEKESLTVLFMYGADGARAPPMLMFKYADRVPPSIIKNCPGGWGIGHSENGWMTTETFREIWRTAIMKYKSKNNITRLKKEHVASVLEEALDSFENEKKTIRNSFRAAGLVPLNSDVVQYNVLQKKKKRKEQKECIPENSSQANEDMKQHLVSLEQNLSDDLVASFKEAEATGIWNKDIGDKSLFEYWLRTKKASGGY